MNTCMCMCACEMICTCAGKDARTSHPIPTKSHRKSHPEQAFDEARRGVLMTTRLGTRWDQEASSASPASRGDDAPCEVPKYALTDPLGANVVNGRVVDAGFSPEPYAAGVPLLLHAEDCSHLLGERTIPSRASSLSQLERFPPRLQRSHSLEWPGPAAPPRRMATSASLETLQVLWAHDELSQPQAETSLTRLRLGDLQREVNLSASQLAAAHAATGRAKVPQVSKMPRSSSDAPLARVAAARSSSSFKMSCSSIAASVGEWPRPGWLSPGMSRSSPTLSVSVDKKLSLDLLSSASKPNLEAAVAAAAARPVVQSL